MEQSGLLIRIIDSVASLDKGRRLLHTEGFESEGRIDFYDGLSLALDVYREAHSYAAEALELLVLAEYTFLTQELQFCDASDTQTAASLNQAIESFDDAFLALKVVADSSKYKSAELTYPHNNKYRIKGMPKDAFHIACLSHRTRIDNILRAPGINIVEKELLKQRKSNLAVAQEVYLLRQMAALSQAKGQTD